MSKQVMKQALDALENLSRGCGFDGWQWLDGEDVGGELNDAVTALREAIAAPDEALKAAPASAQWIKMNAETLSEISQCAATDYWLFTKSGRISRGAYEWRQGRNPDRFIGECGDLHTDEIDFIAKLQLPAPPTNIAQPAIFKPLCDRCANSHGECIALGARGCDTIMQPVEKMVTPYITQAQFDRTFPDITQPVPAVPYQVTEEDVDATFKATLIKHAYLTEESVRTALQAYEARKAAA